MPVTFAHPAAVLPVKRLLPGLPLSALVWGSLAPDVPYFLLTQSTFHHAGHRSWGVVLWNLPVGLLLLALWHGFFKAPLTALIADPDRRARLWTEATRPSPLRERNGFALSAAAVLIGAATHLLWDSFTHADHLGARLLYPAGLRGPLSLLMQYGGTLAGALILSGAVSRWLRRPGVAAAKVVAPPPAPRRTRAALLAWALLVCPVLGVGYTVGNQTVRGWDSPRKSLIADTIQAAVLFATLGTAVYAARWKGRATVCPPAGAAPD